MTFLLSLFKRLSRDTKGASFVEFALISPILLMTAGGAIELTNYVIVSRNISDIATMAADNASRMGADEDLANKPISERDINDVLNGAKLQSGKLDLMNNGKIILTSVELNPDGGQWLRWQRCSGGLPVISTIGAEGLGATGDRIKDVDGVSARSNTAVMIAQVTYQYKPFWNLFPFNFDKITETASFNVRDPRDFTEVYNEEKVDVQVCA
jgi:hypothetical protein